MNGCFLWNENGFLIAELMQKGPTSHNAIY